MPAVYIDNNGTEHYYIPPPPRPQPPPPPPKPTPQQAQGQATSSQATINYDHSTLPTLQTQLNQALHDQALNEDQYRVQAILRLEGEIRSLQSQLTANERTLSQAKKELNHFLTVEIPKQTSHAIQVYGKAAAHAPGSPSLTTAATNLQSAGFDQEVFIYEQTHGGQYWLPGSAQWKHDASALLGNPDALHTSQDVVMEQFQGDLRGSGVTVPQFGAQLWAGAAVAQAQLSDPASSAGSQASEKTALTVLSTWLAGLDNGQSGGIDPQLGRQALFDNTYVSSTLGQQIARTMRGLSGKAQTQSAGLGYLYQLLGNKDSHVDPQVVTVIVQALSPTLRQELEGLSGASTDQATQGYVYVAGLYYVLLNAQQAGVAGAGTLAQQLAQWSYNSVDSTNANAPAGGRGVGFGDSNLDDVLTGNALTRAPGLLTKIQQENVAPNLLYEWQQLASRQVNSWNSQHHYGPGPDAGLAWIRFQEGLDGVLKAQPLVGKSPLTPPVPGLSPDQVHSTYDTDLQVVQQSGDVPAGVNPLALAGIQTLMTSGFGGAADEGSLARSMIGAEQQQVDQQWRQQNGSQAGLMPVDALTGVAGTEVLGLGRQLGLGGKSWSKAVSQAEHGMEATPPNAPSVTSINNTNTAYQKLQKALASGNQGAIAVAQAGWDEALSLELQSVYGNRFSGTTLVNDDEDSDWYYLAQTQVLLDHDGSAGMIKAVSIGLQVSAIVESSMGAGLSPQQKIASLDMDLAALQAPGADPGGAISRAVLDDARVRSLIAAQVAAATSGKSSNPTEVLKTAAGVLAYFEENDPSGPAARQIVSGVLDSPVIRAILAKVHGEAAHSPDVLKLAAPLVQAAQLSPSLTLAVFDAFNLPVNAGKPAKNDANTLVVAARSVRSAADFRALAIIYGALPDNPQVVGVPSQVTAGQQAKIALIGSFRTELGQPKSVAAQNLGSWIGASFDGPSSAPAWFAADLLNGYQYEQGDHSHTVGQVSNPALITTLKKALYQPTGGSGNSSSGGFMSPVDMSAAASADGTTLQAFSSETALIDYVAQAYGLGPSSAAGASASYDLKTVVFGNTTLGQIIAGLQRQAGITSPSADSPIVLQAAPVMIGEGQSAEFRVQKADGSIVWLGADGSITQGWGGLNTILTNNVSTTVEQVVGGVTEADANGNANPLLKIDTPAVPAVQSHPWWEDVVKSALALTAALVVSALGQPELAFVAAFLVEQAFDVLSHNGEMTVFQYDIDLAEGKVGWKQTKELALDAGPEAIEALADALIPGTGKLVSGAIATFVGGKILAAAAPVVVDVGENAAATAVTAGTNAGVTAATAGTSAGVTAATAGTSASATAVTAGTSASVTAVTTGTDASVTAVTTGTEAGVTDGTEEALWKAASKAAAQKAGYETVYGRLFAALGAGAAQGSIQGISGLATSVISLAQQGKLTWSSFLHVAEEQGVNLGLSTVSAGVAGGLLPANIAVQTVVGGFGMGLGQNLVNAQLFKGPNQSFWDLVFTAAVMTVPMTMEHYTIRASEEGSQTETPPVRLSPETRGAEPGAGSTATPGEESNTVPSGEAVPPPAAAGGSRPPPNANLEGYFSILNPQPEVVIIGGGNVGHMLQTDLTMNNLPARLLFRGDGSREDRITPATGEIIFKENLYKSITPVVRRAEHFGYMDTAQGLADMQQARILVATIPDAPLARLQLFRDLQEKGLVQNPNKTIVLIRGGQAGQPVLAQMIRDNPSWKATMVLVEDSPYGGRYIDTEPEKGLRIETKRKDDVEISVLAPNRNITQGLEAMRWMFPLGEQIRQLSWPNFTVIDGSAMPFKFGYAIHPRVAFDLVNLRMTINKVLYRHYNQGVHPALGEVLEQLDGERVELARAFGVDAETFPLKLHRQYKLPLIPGEPFYRTMQRTWLSADDPNSREVYISMSHKTLPKLMSSRYPQEDVPGLFTMNWLAGRAGLVLPGHVEYDSYIRDILRLLGMSGEDIHTKLEAYLPAMEQIPGGVTQIKDLLDSPYDRPPPPESQETINLKGPPGPTSPGGGTPPSGGTPPQPRPPDTSSGSPPNANLTAYHPTTNLEPVVALVGGGNVGHTLLTDLTDVGQQARLLFRGDGSGADRVTPATGTITFNEQLRGGTHTVQLGREHFGYMDTPEGLATLHGAKIIVITMPDAPQSRLQLFGQLQQSGLVQDPNKTIVLIRAGQAGQPVLSQIIRNNPNWRASVVLVEDSPYGTRYKQTPNGNIITGKRKDDVEISVLGPDGNIVPGLTDMRLMFPLGAEIGRASWPDFTVIPGSAMPFKFGYVIHPRVAFDLRNLRMTVNGRTYLHYNEGVYPALGEVLGQLDEERVQLAAAFGVRAEYFPEKLHRQFDLPLIPGESFHGTMLRTLKTDDPNSRQIYVSTSHGSIPDLLGSRYPQEDVPGLFTMNWLASRAGLVLPGHAEYESYIRDILGLLRMPDEEVQNKLGGYLPLLDQIPGGVPEIKALLDTPHDRTPPEGGRERIILSGPPGPTGPTGSATPSGESPGPTPDPSGSSGSPPDATSPVFF